MERQVEIDRRSWQERDFGYDTGAETLEASLCPGHLGATLISTPMGVESGGPSGRLVLMCKVAKVLWCGTKTVQPGRKNPRVALEKREKLKRQGKNRAPRGA